MFHVVRRAMQRPELKENTVNWLVNSVLETNLPSLSSTPRKNKNPINEGTLVCGLRDNLLPWHDVTGKQSYRSRLRLFADYCFGPPTFVYRLFLLSCNEKINWKPSSGRSLEMKCSKRLIHKQFVQVSGLCGPQFLSYFPKRFMHLCRAVYGDAILVYRFGAPIWQPEINKNIWSSLFL